MRPMKRARSLFGALLVTVSISLISSANAAHPGRNGLIAYVADGAIYSIYPDGSHKKKLTKSDYDAYHMEAPAYPTWSPDGKKIAFVAVWTALNGGEPDTTVVVINADGSDPHPVGGTAAVSRPSWSPDGSEIAYAAPRYLGSPDRQIVVTRADNTGGRIIASGFDPAWSPDGRTIVFATGGSLAAVDPDGNNRRTLTQRYVFRPDWSPDGSQLLFDNHVSGSGGYPGTIYTAKADGSEVHAVYEEGSINGYAASWSPDGTKIVLTVEDDNFAESIKYLRPDGTLQSPLFTPAVGATPDWQPCGQGAHCPVTTPCVVPRVIGLAVARARTAIRKAGCAVGTTKRPRHVAFAKTVVAKQSPRARARVPHDTKVNLVLRRKR